MPLIECVPNFSEGRRPEVIAAIREAIAAVRGVRLLDLSADPWHNRTVITFAAPPDAVLQGAFAGIRAARDLIDLSAHQGVHPRMGAADVVPFVPLQGSTLDDCAEIARELGDRVGRELHIPVFLYEHAAVRPSRRLLADVRRGGFERLREKLGTSPEHAPDYGPHRMHPTAGAVAIGARAPLVAFNAYLGPSTALPEVRQIARSIRESSGGLPGVRALAFDVNGQAQLSMNLVDLDRAGLWEVYDRITREAAARGLELTRTEIVGLVPEQALWQAGASAMRLTSFDAAHVLEHRQRDAVTAADLDSLLDRIAAPTSAPGGGSVAAYAGALAASLAAMVAGIAARRGLGGDAASAEAISALRSAADELLWLADEDSEAYTRYMEARQAKRDTDPPLLEASRVPLRIARAAAHVAAAAADLAQTGLPAAAADAASAALLADAVCAAAALTARVNVAGLSAPELGAALLVEAEELTAASRSHAERAAGSAAPATA